MQPSPWTIERHEKVASTMDVAREKARAGAPDGTVVVADEMAAGRGTHGRQWFAPKGGLYLSLILRDLRDPHLLTLALGNAVAAALEVAGVDPQLKWVNDVWLDGKKIAGILVESESTGDQIDFLIAGIGINVNGGVEGFPVELRAQSTTLETALRCESCIPDLEVLLLHEIETAVRQVREGRNADILMAFRQRDMLKGQTVEVTDGKAAMTGVAEGVDHEGRLLVRTSSGSEALATGSVRLLST